jgi:ABC-2 type transport system ATP-binding protein
LALAKTVILTTHNMDEADRVADRVAIIDHGRLLELDTPHALRARVGEGDVVEIGLLQAASPTSIEAASQALTPLVDQFRMDDGQDRVSIRALNAIKLLPSILEAMESAGLHPGEVRVRENTLEDVFIQLTGRRLRE